MSFHQLLARFQILLIIADNQEIIHIPDIKLCVKLLFHKVVKSVQHRNACNLDELTARIVSGVALILFVEDRLYHAENFCWKFLLKQILCNRMAHVGVITMYVELRYIAIMSMLSVISMQELFQSVSCRVCSFALLTGKVIVYKAFTHGWVYRIVI